MRKRFDAPTLIVVELAMVISVLTLLLVVLFQQKRQPVVALQVPQLHDDVPPIGFDRLKSVAPVSFTTAQASIACDGDGATQQRVQAMYVFPDGQENRYQAYLPSFQIWLAQADSYFDTSAQQTGGTRHVRFVHDADCVPTVLEVPLSPTGTQSFGQSINELYSLGFSQTDRDYLMFADAHVYCGISTMEYDDLPGPANRSNLAPHFARVDSGCWSGVIAAHEMMHTFGGVQFSAPHSDSNAHCNDGYDNMCDHSGHLITYPCADPAGDNLFDCNHDDYFYAGTPPASNYLATHWNTADSFFLIGAPTPCFRGNSGKPCR